MLFYKTGYNPDAHDFQSLPVAEQWLCRIGAIIAQTVPNVQITIYRNDLTLRLTKFSNYHEKVDVSVDPQTGCLSWDNFDNEVPGSRRYVEGYEKSFNFYQPLIEQWEKEYYSDREIPEPIINEFAQRVLGSKSRKKLKKQTPTAVIVILFALYILLRMARIFF